MTKSSLETTKTPSFNYDIKRSSPSVWRRKITAIGTAAVLMFVAAATVKAKTPKTPGSPRPAAAASAAGNQVLYLEPKPFRPHTTETTPDPDPISILQLGSYDSQIDPKTGLHNGTLTALVYGYMMQHGITASDNPNAPAGTVDPASQQFRTQLENVMRYNVNFAGGIPGSRGITYQEATGLSDDQPIYISTNMLVTGQPLDKGGPVYTGPL